MAQEDINKINQAKQEGGEAGIAKLEEIKADAEISMEGDIVRLAEEAITEIRNAGDQAKMVTASEENQVITQGGNMDEANIRVAEVNAKIQAVEENAKQEIQAVENSNVKSEPAISEESTPEPVPVEQPVVETVTENTFVEQPVIKPIAETTENKVTEAEKPLSQLEKWNQSLVEKIAHLNGNIETGNKEATDARSKMKSAVDEDNIKLHRDSFIFWDSWTDAKRRELREAQEQLQKNQKELESVSSS